jgi:hypothetical protein
MKQMAVFAIFIIAQTAAASDASYMAAKYLETSTARLISDQPNQRQLEKLNAAGLNAEDLELANELLGRLADFYESENMSLNLKNTESSILELKVNSDEKLRKAMYRRDI